MTFEIRIGHCLELLGAIATGSVNCCVTSPPYWGLRDYGLKPSAWPAISYAPMPGLPKCVNVPAMECCLGLEPTLEAFIGHLVLVFEEVRRVLRDDGTCWVNMGDAYVTRPSTCGGWNSVINGKASQGEAAKANKVCKRNRTSTGGLKLKDMIGQPWRVAFALQAAGWFLRRDVIWSKTNSMPETVTDRPATSHEYLFLLTKSSRYSYDAEAVKEPVTGRTHLRGHGVNAKIRAVGGWDSGPGDHQAVSFQRSPKDEGRAAQGLKTGAKLGRSPGWRSRQNASMSAAIAGQVERRNRRSVWTIPCAPFKGAHFATYPEKLVEPCIRAGCPAGGEVLDIFNGSGTTGVVAVKLGCNYTGLELNPAYAEMAYGRVHAAYLQGVPQRIDGVA